MMHQHRTHATPTPRDVPALPGAARGCADPSTPATRATERITRLIDRHLSGSSRRFVESQRQTGGE